MEITTKKVKLNTIRLNPENPRTISKKDMDLLVKSLADFPEMLELREIVVDDTMTVLGGNMRTLALRKVGAKEVTAKIVTGLTPEQKREFVIKDNGEYGRWDFDALANSWGDLPLIEWGVNVPGIGDDPNEEWKGMPEIGDTTKGVKQLIVNFETDDDIKEFSRIIAQAIGEKTKSIWYPQKRGSKE